MRKNRNTATVFLNTVKIRFANAAIQIIILLFPNKRFHTDFSILSNPVVFLNIFMI